MSELKVYVKPIKTNMFGKMIVGQSYYLKSEADKVLAEKDKEIRHHKYKQCLAMAQWCALAKQFEDTEWYRKWINKWHERWLELAEKFKPNNSTAQ